jgi:AcrR family transcriptional regulator
MSRQPDPMLRAEILEKCLKAALRKGTVDFSIHELGKAVGTSPRMLIYHFGSKAQLDEALVLHLDEAMRLELAKFLNQTSKEPVALGKIWDFITGNDSFRRLTKLSMGVNLGSNVSKATQKKIEAQTQSWIASIETHFKPRPWAELVYLLGQGAMIDFFLTGNQDRGRRSLECLSNELTKATKRK